MQTSTTTQDITSGHTMPANSTSLMIAQDPTSSSNTMQMTVIIADSDLATQTADQSVIQPERPIEDMPISEYTESPLPPSSIVGLPSNSMPTIDISTSPPASQIPSLAISSPQTDTSPEVVGEGDTASLGAMSSSIVNTAADMQIVHVESTLCPSSDLDSVAGTRLMVAEEDATESSASSMVPTLMSSNHNNLLVNTATTASYEVTGSSTVESATVPVTTSLPEQVASLQPLSSSGSHHVSEAGGLSSAIAEVKLKGGRVTAK